MRGICRKCTFAMLSVLFALWVVITSFISYQPLLQVKADAALTYEQTNVLDDLKNSTINGQPFSLEDFGFDAKKNTQVLSFVEYCYSFYEDLQDNFGLYVYIYNPKGLNFAGNHPLNSIQMTYGTESATSYTKYPLKYLNCCMEPDYERVFYKFKVDFTPEQRQTLLETLNSGKRVYTISSVELMLYDASNATDITVGSSFTYSGYAAGFGSNPYAQNTLKCETEQTEVLSLNVNHTVYRPEGTNGKSEWHKDSLHSVYFAVPNDIIQKYGIMSAVHATWLNAVLAPSLVTGNYSAYTAINEYLGQTLPSTSKGYHTDDLYYMYYGACEGAGSGFSNATCYFGYGYNAMTGWSGHSMIQNYHGEIVNPLYAMYYAGSGTDSADNFTVSSESIMSKLNESRSKYGGELVNGKYSRVMFSSVDSQFTEVNIKADETYSLTDQRIDKSWWDGLFGIGVADKVTTNVFNDIRTIYPVKETDLSGTKAEICKRLYISEADYDDFMDFYKKNKGLATIYLFRYQTSDYISQEATLYEYYKDGSIFTTGRGWQKCDTNAYFFQQTVNLDFDIIDVTFTTGTVETVIPVVSNPIDVVSNAEPPVHTQSDKTPLLGGGNGSDVTDTLSKWVTWLKMGIVILVAGFLFLFVFWPIMKPLLISVGKGIISLCKKPGEWIENRRQRKNGEDDQDDEENG